MICIIADFLQTNNLNLFLMILSYGPWPYLSLVMRFSQIFPKWAYHVKIDLKMRWKKITDRGKIIYQKSPEKIFLSDLSYIMLPHFTACVSNIDYLLESSNFAMSWNVKHSSKKDFANFQGASPSIGGPPGENVSWSSYWGTYLSPDISTTFLRLIWVDLHPFPHISS